MKHKFDAAYLAKIQAKVVAQIQIQEDGCWMWTGGCNVQDVPQIGGSFEGQHWGARVHNLVHEWTFGEMPEDKILVRSCANQRCVSPHHFKPSDRSVQTAKALGGRRKPTRESDIARFNAKYVERFGCWIWTGVRNGRYGSMEYQGRSRSAHVVSHLLFNGPIPEGHVVMHACDDPTCVNPAHLSTGTHAENMADMVKKRRCRYGSKNASATSDEETVAQLKNEFMPGVDGEVTRLANKYRMSLSKVSSILTGKAWGHVKTSEIPFVEREAFLSARARGVEHHRAKLTEAQVLEMRAKYECSEISLDQIVDQYGIKKAQACAIVNRKAWTHLP